MCTGFVKKGKDLIIGYNLDIDPAVWDFKLLMNKDLFTVAIKIGSTTYYTHGINSNGNYGCIPYMNDPTPYRSKGHERIDLLVNNYIRGKIDYKDVIASCKKEVSNINFGSMHALLCDREANCVIVEPGCGYKEIEDDYAVISNYPLLKPCLDDNKFYGKDRYELVTKVLKESNSDFNYLDGLKLLKEVSQVGTWATRLSFVYSKCDNAVYYCDGCDFDNIKVHKF